MASGTLVAMLVTIDRSRRSEPAEVVTPVSLPRNEPVVNLQIRRGSHRYEVCLSVACTYPVPEGMMGRGGTALQQEHGSRVGSKSQTRCELDSMMMAT